MAGELQLLVLQQYSPPVWPSTVTCTTQTAHLSYSALQIVSHYRLRYLCSYLHHTNSTPQLFCTAKCVTVQAQIFMQLPASQKQHTSVILHCKLCHSIGSDITCITETAHLSYSALRNVLQYRLRYSCSYLHHTNSTPQLFCTAKCVTLHAQIFKQLSATTETAHLGYSAL